MNQVLVIVLPIIVMLMLGKLCSILHILPPSGINGIKSIVVNIILPVALFHGMATIHYNLNTMIICLAMTTVLFLSLVGGHLFKPLIKEAYRKYLPFITTSYEGGMIGYSLYTNACGTDHLSNIAMMDIAACIFGLSVIASLMVLQEDGVKPTAKGLLKDSLRKPVVIGIVLGMILGISGLMNAFLSTPASLIYEAIESEVTAALCPMILIVIGYNMNFTKVYIQPALRTIAIRVIIQVILAIPMYLLVNYLFNGNLLLRLAIIIYMISPPSYSLPAFAKSEDGSMYMATTNSMYCILTVILYAIAVGIFL